MMRAAHTAVHAKAHACRPGLRLDAGKQNVRRQGDSQRLEAGNHSSCFSPKCGPELPQRIRAVWHVDTIAGLYTLHEWWMPQPERAALRERGTCRRRNRTWRRLPSQPIEGVKQRIGTRVRAKFGAKKKCDERPVRAQPQTHRPKTHPVAMAARPPEGGRTQPSAPKIYARPRDGVSRWDPRGGGFGPALPRFRNRPQQEETAMRRKLSHPPPPLKLYLL
ncbi:hypothetical protein MRX96_008215 [Rhipicephalus microplus]